jgi:hypothetical protein
MTRGAPLLAVGCGIEHATGDIVKLIEESARIGPRNRRKIILSRAVVDNCHEVALTNGARSEGPPGLRPEYHPNYYGAYIRDLDGNKVCVCCHHPE